MRVGIIALVALFLGGCVTEQGSRVPLAINSIAMLQMENTHSILQKRRIASLSCRKAGYQRRTDAYQHCMSALIARDLQRTRERAERLTLEAAQQHGVCLQRDTFTISRCIEI